MSTSLLYHGFGLHGYDYVKTSYKSGQVIFSIRQKRDTYRCSACRSDNLILHGEEERTLQTVPIGSLSCALPG